MKKNLLVQACLAGLLILLAWPLAGTSQGPMGGGKGGRMRPGGPGGGGMDPGAFFDKLAGQQGAASMPISEAKFFAQPLAEWAQQNGISGPEVTREQFTAFMA